VATTQTIVDVALAAVEARRAGRSTYTHSGITFKLNAGGYCARFVRQCHEAALGKGEWTWAYNAPNAYEMERKLKAAGTIVATPQPGDIVGMSKSGKAPGHIGIYLGDGMIAENTSATRGNPSPPGTKVTRLSDIGANRVTHYYRAMPLPAAADDAQLVKLVVHGTGTVVAAVRVVPNGNHIDDQGKLYIEKPRWV
jgi:hypothetical protein